MSVAVSGELTATVGGAPLGAPRFDGSIEDVWISVGASGKDDTNSLSVEADVRINGTSALTTKPKIAHVSGEASQQKTTKVSGDTGVTQVDLNESANTFSAGDVISYDLVLTRTASPTTEISNVALVVELLPT
jgi:hypothetical protein